MLDLLIRGCRLPGRDAPVDVAIADGLIVQVGPVAEPARETIDARGRLLTPGLSVECERRVTWRWREDVIG